MQWGQQQWGQQQWGGADLTPPALSNQSPAPGSTGNDPFTAISAQVTDLQLKATSVKFWVNGTLAWFSAAPTASWTGTRTAVANGYNYSFAPDEVMPLIAGLNTVRVYAEDDAGNVLDENWTFSCSAVSETAEVAEVAGELNTGLDLKLATDTHDLVLESYDLQLVAGVDEVAQHLLVNLRLFYGEWYLDDEAGMPYYRDFFIAAPRTRTIEAIFRQTILGDPDIESLTTFDMEHDRQTRKLDVEFEAVSSVGVVEVSSVFP
jgi:hypothetical protein